MSWKSVAIPAEHGGWGVLGEVILIGVFLAPSMFGLVWGIAMLSAWFLRQPLRVLLRERKLAGRSKRLRFAAAFGLLYGIILLGTGAAVWIDSPQTVKLTLLVMAAGSFLVLLADARNQQREAIWELAAVATLSAGVTVFLFLGGWSIGAAAAVFSLVLMRHLSAVWFIRHRLRAAYGRPHSPGAVAAVFGFGLVLFIAVTLFLSAAWWMVLVYAGMALYVANSFKMLDTSVKPKVLGWHQLAFGLVFCLALFVSLSREVNPVSI